MDTAQLVCIGSREKLFFWGGGVLKEGKAFCLLSKLSHEKTVPIA